MNETHVFEAIFVTLTKSSSVASNNTQGPSRFAFRFGYTYRANERKLFTEVISDRDQGQSLRYPSAITHCGSNIFSIVTCSFNNVQ